MDIRNDPEHFDERLDEFADTPPLRPVPIDRHDNNDDNDNAQSATPSKQVDVDQSVQPPAAPASSAPPVSLLGSDPADVQDRWRDLRGLRR